MGSNDNRFRRIKPLLCELDQAMIVTFESLDPIGQWPWLSSNPEIQAIWEALTRPENLSELEAWWDLFDGGSAMNDWAMALTRKAIEVSRSRTTGSG